MNFEQSLRQEQVPPSGGMTDSYFPEFVAFLDQNEEIRERLEEEMYEDASLPEGLSWASVVDYWFCRQYPDYREACIDYYRAEESGDETKDLQQVKADLEGTSEGSLDLGLVSQALIESAQEK